MCGRYVCACLCVPVCGICIYMFCMYICIYLYIGTVYVNMDM